jgi:hypothetical protein
MITGRSLQAEHAELNTRIESLSEKIDSSIGEIQLS